ncbi:MAG TPA: C40 family peptidase [Nocardioides sp.]|nr:C40 family peptidase [Nocardioides sp.]
MTLILRALASGALAIGLLSTAPVTLDRAHGATGGATESRQTQQRTARQATLRKVGDAVRIAARQKGDPYAAGAEGPNAFDCSGLTYYSYRKAGFKHLPRTSSAQARFVDRVKRRNMRRGDLIFFYDGGGVYHVGVYAGRANGHRQVLHSGSSGTRVRTDRVWTDQWFAGTLRHR